VNDLRSIKCEACKAGAPMATQEEINEFMPQLSGWDIIEHEGINQLRKTFTFKNFSKSLDFTNKIGAIAEEEHHHPSILTEWGKVTVTWWSHKIKGLHTNDFIMAVKSDDAAFDDK